MKKMGLLHEFLSGAPICQTRFEHRETDAPLRLAVHELSARQLYKLAHFEFATPARLAAARNLAAADANRLSQALGMAPINPAELDFFLPGPGCNSTIL
jgi:hypothetical protein